MTALDELAECVDRLKQLVDEMRGDLDPDLEPVRVKHLRVGDQVVGLCEHRHTILATDWLDPIGNDFALRVAPVCAYGKDWLGRDADLMVKRFRQGRLRPVAAGLVQEEGTA